MTLYLKIFRNGGRFFFWTGTCNSTYYLIYASVYIYMYYGQFVFRLCLGWTRTAGRKSLPFHWQITRMVKFPASYVSSLEGTSLEMNMSPEKGTISKRKVVFQSLLLRGFYWPSFVPVWTDMGHQLWTCDIETTTKPPRRFPELWEVF